MTAEPATTPAVRPRRPQRRQPAEGRTGPALESDARVPCVEESTQGIDINAKAKIRRLFGECAATRRVVVATSEFEELACADDVVVLCLGRERNRWKSGMPTHTPTLTSTEAPIAVLVKLRVRPEQESAGSTSAGTWTGVAPWWSEPQDRTVWEVLD